MSDTQSEHPQPARGVPAEAVIERMQTKIGELQRQIAILEVQLEQAWETRQEMDGSRAQRGESVGGSSEPR